MLHIIGIAHCEQCSADGAPHTDAQFQYVALIEQLIDRTSPSCVAEEDSEEALMRRGSRSLARPVAMRCGVEHRFCDPTTDERKRIGYLSGEYLQIQSFMHDDRNMTQEDIQAKARGTGDWKVLAHPREVLARTSP